MKIKLLCGALLFCAVATYAADSCTVWLWVKDGLYWRKCVNDQGIGYCQEADDNKGTNARDVPCSNNKRMLTGTQAMPWR